jgi:hypothetical protein
MLARPEELSDVELDCELTIAAATRGHLRFDRYQELFDEAQLRGLVSGPKAETGVAAAPTGLST